MAEVPIIILGNAGLASVLKAVSSVSKGNKKRYKKSNEEQIDVTSGFDPLLIFPEELWCMIFQYLGPTDRINFCKGHPFFYDKFGDSSSQWLLGEILPFLLPHFSCSNEILKMRKVCTFWKNAVDALVEEGHAQRHPFDVNELSDKYAVSGASHCSSLSRLNLLHFPINATDPDQFEKYIRPVGRALSFTVECGWDSYGVQHCFSQVVDLLSAKGGAVGAEIWHFKLINRNRMLANTHFYSILVKCLTLLPNLRTLRVRSYHNIYDSITLRTQISRLKLPPLKHLHSLYFEASDCVLKALLAAYSQKLKKVSATLLNDTRVTLPEGMSELTIKSVTYVCLDTISNYLIGNSVYHKITKFTFDTNDFESVDGSRLVRLVQLLENLVYFKLCIESLTQYRPIPLISKDLKHPGIKYFEIKGQGNVIPFAQLAYAFTGLKYFHMRDYRVVSIQLLDISRGYGVHDIFQSVLERKLYRSSIWDDLPKLKVVSYNDYQEINLTCDRAIVNSWKYSRFVLQLLRGKL